MGSFLISGFRSLAFSRWSLWGNALQRGNDVNVSFLASFVLAGSVTPPMRSGRGRARRRRSPPSLQASRAARRRELRGRRRPRPQLGGQFEFDAAGRLVGVDLSSGRVSASDADLACSCSPSNAPLPHLERLWLSGAGITNAGIRQIASIARLRELSLLDAQIDNDGLRALSGLTRLSSLSIRAQPGRDGRGARIPEAASRPDEPGPAGSRHHGSGAAAAWGHGSAPRSTCAAARRWAIRACGSSGHSRG